HGGGAGRIDVTALDANHAFVQTLYEDFLHRCANPAAGADLDAWAGLVKSLGQASVANLLANSHEAHVPALDDLFVKYLGRFANPGEDAAYVNTLDANTGTLDQVMVGLLSSTEFFNRARSIARNVTVGGGGLGTLDIDTPSANYVQALYQLLLGRQATAA